MRDRDRSLGFPIAAGFKLPFLFSQQTDSVVGHFDLAASFPFFSQGAAVVSIYFGLDTYFEERFRYFKVYLSVFQFFEVLPDIWLVW